MPTIAPSFKLENLDELLLELSEHDKTVSAGVASVGEAAAYAEVWEWGNVRQTKEGPKTTRGINPDGEEVWLSIQAPFGYIKINESRYQDILQEEMEKVEFKGTRPEEITQELRRAANRAMTRCAVLISNSAPVDSGALAASFEVIEDDDQLLDESQYDDERTLTLE